MSTHITVKNGRTIDASVRPMIGREYLRVSKDPDGRARSLDEQHDDNARAGERHGFDLNGAAYKDPGLSASKYATKIRGDFERLLSDLEGGRFGADLLVLWESSRGSRKVSEWCRLIEACESAGVLIHVTMHQRTYDPANGRDVRSLIDDANDAQFESWKTSERTGRSGEDRARRGEPHGRLPYGYRRRYDERTRRLVAQEPDAAEAAVVVELFERIASGHSIKSIARDFEERGIRTRHCPGDCETDHKHRAGKVFDPQQLRGMAFRPVYAGLRWYEPGNSTGYCRGSLDGAVKGTWPPLVEPELFFSVRALLMDPSRLTARPGRAKHLLSMIAVCDRCGGKLAVTYRSRNMAEYQCRLKSCVRILATDLDEFATAVMLGYLSRPEVIGQLRDGTEDSAELTAVRTDLAEARASLTSWRQAAGAGKVTPESWSEIEPGLMSRLSALEVREAELTAPRALSVLPPGTDIALRWDAAPVSARRMVAKMLLTPAILGQLRLGKAPVKGRRGDPAERVIWQH